MHARARTDVDLPVPRCPMIITPPILRSTVASISARFISSWPTMAAKGYTGEAFGSIIAEDRNDVSNEERRSVNEPALRIFGNLTATDAERPATHHTGSRYY